MATKIIFTREQAPNKDWLEVLTKAQFEPHHLPLICCQLNPLSPNIAADIPTADWVLFTSAVAVNFFSTYLTGNQIKIGTIGLQTSTAVAAEGYSVDFEARSHYALEVVKEWLNLGLPPQKILLPQSSLSNPLIADKLRQQGHTVLNWALYDTVTNPVGQKQIKKFTGEEDVIWTFASASAWHSFQTARPSVPASHQIAVIGATTAAAVKADGYRVDFMPSSPSIDQMIAAIIEKKGRSL